MDKMKLQGKNLNKISKEKREKTEETLEIMEETRKEDTIQLRKLLQEELKYYIEEFNRNLKLEQQFKEELKISQENKLKLIGAISALKKVLGEK